MKRTFKLINGKGLNKPIKVVRITEVTYLSLEAAKEKYPPDEIKKLLTERNKI